MSEASKSCYDIVNADWRFTWFYSWWNENHNVYSSFVKCNCHIPKPGKCRGFWQEAGIPCDKKCGDNSHALFYVIFCGGLAISVYEELPLLDCLYEAASAVGTVGLTLGITPKLHMFSQNCADYTDVSGACRWSDSDLCGAFKKKQGEMQNCLWRK